MKKTVFIFLSFILFVSPLSAQLIQSNKVISKTFNYGFRVGFNAGTADNYNVYVDSMEIMNRTITNNVGFQGALFCRVNIQNIFFQPEFGYSFLAETLVFNYPAEEVAPALSKKNSNFDVTIKQGSQSLNASMLLGYNIVKKDAYLFNLFIGPNLRGIYKNTFNKGEQQAFKDTELHYNLSGIGGVSANIAYLYFDFRYEFNIPTRTDIYFKNMKEAPKNLENIMISKNKNLLSFTLGFMF